MEIDFEKRKLHSRLHSAGHLLDAAVEKLNLNWKGQKGYHFLEGSYVSYKILDKNKQIEDREKLKSDLENQVNNLVKQNLEMQIEIDTDQTFREKPLRTVNFLGFKKCGCGGTHVKNSSEIGPIQIRKIKIKKDEAKVSYTLT